MISINSKYKATVLLVESNSAISRLVEEILTRGGYSVCTARLGSEAIEKSKGAVNLILMDLVLADMEGLELCHYFKQSEPTRHIPIIILNSAKLRTSEGAQCIRLGADDFISEPVEASYLLSTIERLILAQSFSHSHRAERFQELKHILDHGLVDPYFQPIYQLNPFSLLGIEVLTRSQEEGILKNPELLFATALEFGFYFNLEMMVWSKALDTFKAKAADQRLFLNCSPTLVENDHFAQVQGMFEQRVINFSSVFFELTERSTMSKENLFFERLRKYKNLGFRLAVDDVGSGYSSLEAIVETRPEVVKIDRQIVRNLNSDSYKVSIVKFIVSFCHEHDIICVAEGVETKDELQIVKELGVNACQGYLFCRPTPQLDVSAFQSIIV